MATKKSFTDISQSKKLAEILPIESADMCYRIIAYNPNDTHVYQPYCFVGTLESDVPCWSLTALLNYLREINFLPEIDADKCEVTMNIKLLSHTAIHNIKVKAKNFIDACYEMILKLHEQKLL